MFWELPLIISAAAFFASVIWAVIVSKSKYKSGRVFDPSKIFVVGIIVSAVVLFIPIYIKTFETEDCGIIETLLLSVYNMITLFLVDADFDFVTNNLKDISEFAFRGYTVMASVLFVVAPIMTFGFVLSFFKNISAYKKYFSRYKSDACIFSELNEKSLALAKDFKNNDPKKVIIFTDVFDKEEERDFELQEAAKELGALFFKKDISTVNFGFHSKKSLISFFAIGEDQTENINQALTIIKNYKYRENTNLYVFSTQIESELLLASAFNDDAQSGATGRIKVRRVNEVQSLISRNLYENGYDLIFKNALPDQNGVKRISAVVVGMGQHGTELTKALAWFCQMDGYLAEINCYDKSPNAESVFRSLCPELMDEEHNGVYKDGEAKYKISIHSDVDVNTCDFDNMISKLPLATYVFVALGNDEMNISAAIKLRSLFARMGYMPNIQAVVYNTAKKVALKGITNFKKQPYDIDFIGDLTSSYSENVILRSDVEADALKRHKKWGNESDFWKFDYNYKSSIASAIHYKMKLLCGIKDAEKTPDQREEDAKWALRKLEHCRWNAYMRSEGYCYAPQRNDLAKTHHCLVLFDQLTLEEQIKDDD